MAKKAPTIPAPPAEPYGDWLAKLKAAQGGRPGYKDQTEDSLAALVDLCRVYQPDQVFEIGTSYGASTRAWLHAGVPNVTCIDQQFGALAQSERFLPLNWNVLKLIEKPIQAVPLGQLVRAARRPLVFFDCHGADNMRYVLGQIAGLPCGCFAVDDMWYSPERLDEWTAPQFCQRVVEPEIDTSLPKSLWPQSFANYWQGGAFYSFDEVIPLVAHANQHQITLEHRSKEAWWIVG